MIAVKHLAEPHAEIRHLRVHLEQIKIHKRRHFPAFAIGHDGCIVAVHNAGIKPVIVSFAEYGTAVHATLILKQPGIGVELGAEFSGAGRARIVIRAAPRRIGGVYIAILGVRAIARVNARRVQRFKLDGA